MKKLFFVFALLSNLSFRPQTQTALLYGDSITLGVGASDPAHGWASILSANLGLTQENHGVSGSTISSIGGLPQFDPSTVPTYNAGYKYIFLAFGVNDCNNYGTAANYKTAVLNAIDVIKGKGYPASTIVLISTWYFNTTDPYIDPARATFVTAASEAATAEGVIYVDAYTPVLNDPNKATYFSDNLHPNDTGHSVYAGIVQAGLSASPIRPLPVRTVNFNAVYVQ